MDYQQYLTGNRYLLYIYLRCLLEQRSLVGKLRQKW